MIKIYLKILNNFVQAIKNLIQCKKDPFISLIIKKLLDLLIVNQNKKYLHYLIFAVKIIVMIILKNL